CAEAGADEIESHAAAAKAEATTMRDGLANMHVPPGLRAWFLPLQRLILRGPGRTRTAATGARRKFIDALSNEAPRLGLSSVVKHFSLSNPAFPGRALTPPDASYRIPAKPSAAPANSNSNGFTFEVNDRIAAATVTATASQLLSAE